jgi:hypothetical protein
MNNYTYQWAPATPDLRTQPIVQQWTTQTPIYDPRLTQEQINAFQTTAFYASSNKVWSATDSNAYTTNNQYVEYAQPNQDPVYVAWNPSNTLNRQPDKRQFTEENAAAWLQTDPNYGVNSQVANNGLVIR